MANRDHDRNDEIVGLLNIIGKRLIDSEQERDSLKESSKASRTRCPACRKNPKNPKKSIST